MTNAVVDFETFFDKAAGLSVTKQGNANYVRDADAYIVAIQVGNEVHCGTIAEMGDRASNMASDPTLTFGAANSGFDRAWWNKYYPPTFNMDWQCVLI